VAGSTASPLLDLLAAAEAIRENEAIAVRCANAGQQDALASLHRHVILELSNPKDPAMPQ
jgi:hypothetical protein